MRRPILVGILNVTEDSFSDGGRFLAPEAALAQAHALMDAGADVLDIGAASSNPSCVAVPVETEIARLAPVVAAAKGEGWPVSIDSFAPQTQHWALEQKIAYLNDIQGFPEPALTPALAASAAKLIVMHSVQEKGPATRADTDPAAIMDRVMEFFRTRIAALTGAGIARTRLILDPGMGFFLGADPEVSLAVLRQIPALKSAFGLPVLISVSRKSFLRKLSGASIAESGPPTLAAELYAASQGADMLRTHDPGALGAALTIWGHIGSGKP